MTNIERQLVQIIATDRTDIPISSLSGKLKRAKPKLARAVELGQSRTYEGDRVYARVETEDRMKARGMREGIELFKENYPRHGDILEGLISEQRVLSETHIYFGMNPGCRLTQDDYTTVLTDLREDEKELCLEVASNSGLYGVGLDIMDDKSESGERVSRLIETNAIIATRAHPKAMHRTIDFILERLS